MRAIPLNLLEHVHLSQRQNQVNMICDCVRRTKMVYNPFCTSISQGGQVWNMFQSWRGRDQLHEAGLSCLSVTDLRGNGAMPVNGNTLPLLCFLPHRNFVVRRQPTKRILKVSCQENFTSSLHHRRNGNSKFGFANPFKMQNEVSLFCFSVRVP